MKAWQQGLLPEPRNLVAQYARTDVRKVSFAVRVMEPWNRLPTKHKNEGNQALKRIRKQEKLNPTQLGGWQMET
jgi:hypothetical protein